MLLNVIEGPYLQDLLNQPAALNRTWARLHDGSDLRGIARDLTEGKYRRVVLTGMGSSFHSLYPLHLSLIRHGLNSQLTETSELIHYMRESLTSDALAIVVSQSGQSAETLALLELVRGRTPVVAVTNSPESPLAAASQVLLLMHAGPESSVSCKTYVASLLTLEWLGAFLTSRDTGMARDQLALACSSTQQYLDSWRTHVDDLGRLASGVRQIFIAGRGPSLATAGTGGLILKESARFPAEGMSCAAFRHGPFEMLRKDILVVILAGDHCSGLLNRRLAEDIRNAGGRSEIVDTGEARAAFRIPDVPASLRPILEILPIQMLSLALAAMNGHEPGKFELASKVTTTE